MIEARKIKEKEKMVFYIKKSVLTKTDADCVYIATL